MPCEANAERDVVYECPIPEPTALLNDTESHVESAWTRTPMELETVHFVRGCPTPLALVG